ncbi:hypothetical protein QQ045_005466 [Rhodiola kirilowii]
MGEGTFGEIVECWDRENNEMVAIKIVRGVREVALIEIEMLEKLGKHDIGYRHLLRYFACTALLFVCRSFHFRSMPTFNQNLSNPQSKTTKLRKRKVPEDASALNKKKKKNKRTLTADGSKGAAETLHSEL